MARPSYASLQAQALDDVLRRFAQAVLSGVHFDGSTFTLPTDIVVSSVEIGTVDQGAAGSAAWPVKQTAATGTLSNVTGDTTSATILAANANRRGATVFNDSTANLFLKLAASAASSTSFTVKMAAGSYYEVPFGYTGALTGIWDAVNGAARVTELV